MIARFLDEGDTFDFACQTTGDCCRHFAIYCTPYDVVRLRGATGLTTTEMLARGDYAVVEESFAAVFTDNAVGALLGLFGAQPKDMFPVARLAKREDARGPRCVYLQDAGLCGVYAHRPGVCRSYPLGRVRTPDGPRWFERDYGCPGKGMGTRTVAAWIAESGLRDYAAGNDHFAAFAERLRVAGVAYADLTADTQSALRTALYDFDRVRDVPLDEPAAALATIDTGARQWMAAVRATG